MSDTLSKPNVNGNKVRNEVLYFKLKNIKSSEPTVRVTGFGYMLSNIYTPLNEGDQWWYKREPAYVFLTQADAEKVMKSESKWKSVYRVYMDNIAVNSIIDGMVNVNDASKIVTGPIVTGSMMPGPMGFDDATVDRLLHMAAQNHDKIRRELMIQEREYE